MLNRRLRTRSVRCTAGTGDERHHLRAFSERHRPGVGAEQTAAQLAVCSRLWEQAGPGQQWGGAASGCA
jgi:hypothetical protein